MPMSRHNPHHVLFRMALALAAPIAAMAPAQAQALPEKPANSVVPSPALTYADLADLATSSTVIATAQVMKVARLKPEQAPGVAPGHARLYIEARTVAVLSGRGLDGGGQEGSGLDGGGLRESLRYLADVALDARGRPPALNKKTQVILFARTVPGSPGELRLVAPDAQVTWTAELDQRVRGLLTELVAPDAAPRVTGVREAIHVPGNLGGEGETQVSLATRAGEPVSLTIVRRPGDSPVWGVSFSEIVDQAARPPARDTLAWYRLACFLPATLRADAMIGANDSDRAIAAEDYALVIRDLGPCPRSRLPFAGGR